MWAGGPGGGQETTRERRRKPHRRGALELVETSGFPWGKSVSQSIHRRCIEYLLCAGIVLALNTTGVFVSLAAFPV